MRRSSWGAAVDAAVVLAVWAGALFAEDVVVGTLWRDQFAGFWEVVLDRRAFGPIAVAALAPLAVVFVATWRLASRAKSGVSARRIMRFAHEAADEIDDTDDVD